MAGRSYELTSFETVCHMLPGIPLPSATANRAATYESHYSVASGLSISQTIRSVKKGDKSARERICPRVRQPLQSCRDCTLGATHPCSTFLQPVSTWRPIRTAAKCVPKRDSDRRRQRNLFGHRVLEQTCSTQTPCKPQSNTNARVSCQNYCRYGPARLPIRLNRAGFGWSQNCAALCARSASAGSPGTGPTTSRATGSCSPPSGLKPRRSRIHADENIVERARNQRCGPLREFRL